ncbi:MULTISPECIES: ABC transporter permease [unclassified Clostridioides]|uniref:ABC transporter permease n=1 Tax=unclassified Clostridioides TaxID=2635829 RepID=UPI001D101BD7|nr:FtsX-like permease family protein [Clostridioides sp. ES-S-0171-01]MCC0688800.1 FtsX-like permease family protein [Clostridioides sp. ES-S-0056-01]UDN54179.1 FtsX-like permease family protein [Clostridioides sp. ES-S-0054-01]
MKGIFTLAFSYLRKQKGRSFSIIIAIGLATLISFSNIVQKQTDIKLGTEKLHEIFGTYNYEYNDIDNQALQKILNDNTSDITYRFKNRVSKTINLGSIVYKNGVKSILNTYSPYYLEESKYELIKGRAPKNENEIVLDNRAIEEMNLENKLGEEIDFNIVKKYKNTDGKQEIYNKNHKFKLVGIVSRHKDYYQEYKEYTLRAFTGGYTNLISENLITKGGYTNLISENLITNDGFLNVENEKPTKENLYKRLDKYGLTEYNFTVNVGLIQGLNSIGVSEEAISYEIRKMLLPIAVSALLICNIFMMTLFDMKKSIGMLRAIGAKRHQICSIIFIQSLILVIIGVLSGFLIGGGYVYNYISKVYPQNPSLYITKEAILIPILIAVIMVSISNIVTIYKASRVSPVEGMKNNDFRKPRNRFYYKWIRKVFNITGDMAYKNTFRFRTRTILCILSMGLVGSMYITALSNYNKSDMGVMHIPSQNIGEYDIKLTKDNYNVENALGMYSKSDIKKIKNIDDVDDVDGKLVLSGFMNKNESHLEVRGYTEKDLKKLDNYIEEKSDENNSEYINVLINNHTFGTNKPIDKNLKIGELIEIKIPSVNDGKLSYKVEKVRIAGFLDRKWILNNSYGIMITVIMPIEELSKLTNISDVNVIGVKASSGKEKEVENKIEKIIGRKDYNNLESRAKYKVEHEKSQEIVEMQSMFLLLLMSVVASLNIYYTIKTGILIRTRELSTLRSIGMSMKKIKSMLIKESLIYAFLSCIIGSAHAIYKGYKDVSMVNEVMEVGFGAKNLEKFEVPFNEIVIFTFLVIVVCIISVHLSKQKLEKMSISDGINKDE